MLEFELDTGDTELWLMVGLVNTVMYLFYAVIQKI